MQVHNDTATINDTTSITQTKTLDSKIVWYDSDFNVFLKEQADDGLLTLYKMLGQKVKEKKFYGDNVYLSYSDLANGAYIYTIKTEDGQTAGKILKINSESSGPTSRPAFDSYSNPTARIASSGFSANYQVKMIDSNQGPGTGFLTTIDTVLIEEGNLNGFTIPMTPVDPLTVDLTIHVKGLFSGNLENALFYIQDSSGQIDSLRTDSTGQVVFEDLTQGSTFTAGVGGVKDYKKFEGFTITIPNITTYQDTIFNKSYNLVPDSVWSGKGNIKAPVTALEIGDMSDKANIQAALDTSRYHISSTFTNSRQINLSNWLDSISSWTAIPIIKSSTPFSQVQNYNPYTTAQDSIGTNIVPGSHNTLSNDFYLPNGDLVRVRGDPLQTSGFDENAFYHEFYRSQGRSTVTSWTGSVMNPTGGQITDKDIAIFRVLHQLGVERYKNQTHDLINASYLTDTSTIIP